MSTSFAGPLTYSGYPDDENLALTIMYRNGSATAQSCYVDYIFVAQER